MIVSLIWWSFHNVCLHETITLYTFEIYNFCQLYINKAEKRLKFYDFLIIMLTCFFHIPVFLLYLHSIFNLGLITMNISSAFHSTLKVYRAAADLDHGCGSVVWIQKLKDKICLSSNRQWLSTIWNI